MNNTLLLNLHIQLGQVESATKLAESMQTSELVEIKNHCESITKNKRFRSQKTKHKDIIKAKLAIVKAELTNRQQ